MPATAGGSTSGSSTAVTRSARPRKVRVASKYAAGVPKRRISAFATRLVFRLTTSASTAARLVMPSSSWRSGIWRKIASTGSSEKGEGDSGRERERRAEQAPHGTPKPACLSSRLPSAPSRSAMNSSAPARFSVAFTTAT